VTQNEDEVKKTKLEARLRELAGVLEKVGRWRTRRPR